jgi:anion-transporting  ArsA/GET3 family ATPase
MREVFDNLYVMDITSQEALKEYVLLVIRIEALYKAVFENRLVSSFLRLLPALGELTMLGKIWYELQQRRHGRPRFDAVVVDLPATGHARALLEAPRAVCDSIGAGPMKDNAHKLDAMLKDQALTRLHVVTTPEEMPITEAQELLALAQRLPIQSAPLIINQQTAPLKPAWLAAIEPWRQDKVLHQVPEVLATREERRQNAETLLQTLVPEALPEAIRLPHVLGGALDLSTLEALGARIIHPAPAGGGAP